MSDTASNALPHETRLAANGYQYLVNAPMGLPISISTIGNGHVLSFPFYEQVSAFVTGSVEIGFLSATRTATTTFRHGTDGLTWSAWLTFDTPTLAAVSLNANNRIYLQVRVERTGSDTSGSIVWTNCFLQITRDPSASFGAGMLTDTGLQGELQSLFVAAIQSKMPTLVSGAARFKVVKAFPEKQSLSQNLFPIYVSGLRRIGEQSMRNGGTLSHDLWEVEIGIKTIAENKGGLYQGIPLFEYAMGLIRVMFTQRSYQSEAYNFTFKDVVFVNSHLNDWGLDNFTIEDRGLAIGDNDYWQRFLIKFTLDFNNLRYGYPVN